MWLNIYHETVTSILVFGRCWNLRLVDLLAEIYYYHRQANSYKTFEAIKNKKFYSMPVLWEAFLLLLEMICLGMVNKAHQTHT